MTTRKKTKARQTKTQVDGKATTVQEIDDNSVQIQEATESPAGTFPIVGIGASAGGLAAFEAFFSGMPIDIAPEMAFVLVQHLAPDHKSILSELIRRCTPMKVFDVEDGMVVEANCTYIIPPNRDMALLDGALYLVEPGAPRGHRMAIDYFFRSLAQDQREKAIGIVLSGTGSDGTEGVRHIKGEGGMVIAQHPKSAEFDSMPRSAIATGLVDYELPPKEMAARLIACASSAFRRTPRSADSLSPSGENALRKVSLLLRDQIGHDFSQYKPKTILRRIERRMAVHQIATIDAYVKYLQMTAAEAEALFSELMIGVTNFFRDPEAFKALEEQGIPKLFLNNQQSRLIRVWSPGCSTGEEAYSLAILLAEHMEAISQNFKIQFFATDIDGRAIAKARTGLYPASIEADISAERLARFFQVEPDGKAYRISQRIRDMLVFSEQNVIRDPPFSKIDLISCRNLMIYLNSDLQKKLIPLFNYALNPKGLLFLGTSETVGEFTTLFNPVNRKAKIYERRHTFLQPYELPLDNWPSSTAAGRKRTSPITNLEIVSKKPALRKLAEQVLMRQVASVAALVNSRGDLLYIHGRTGAYLEPIPGEVGVANILKMARRGLQRDLTAALHKAIAGQEVVRYPGVKVKTNGDFTAVNLTVRRADKESRIISAVPLYLVILEEVQVSDRNASKQPNNKAKNSRMLQGPSAELVSRIGVLEEELRAKEAHLQTYAEELETANEELKSSNEEMQSVNEELQSTNEELETSKEELQSINEELATVNFELQHKLTDLTRAGNDMKNLLAGTGIGTVFVDTGFNILSFTPAARTIINLIDSDIGRPIGHIAHNLKGYDSLLADLQQVLDSLIAKELVVETLAGAFYTMRILPYRTINNVIEGGVMTFVDITATRRLEAALHNLKDQMAQAFAEAVKKPLLVLDASLYVVAANERFYDLFKVDEDETIGCLLYDLGNRQWHIPALCRMLEDTLQHNNKVVDYNVSHEFEHIGQCSMRLNAHRIHTESDQAELILLVIEEIKSSKLGGEQT